MSCDGPPQVQDRFRRYADGRGSAETVVRTLDMAAASLPLVLVNAVYRPETLEDLPDTIDFLSRHGIRQIYLNPDVSAPWRQEDAGKLDEVYGKIGRKLAAYYRSNDPHFISLIDSKITVMLRGGYQLLERCRMGTGEFAFAPAGHVFPWERFAAVEPQTHSIGSSTG